MSKRTFTIHPPQGDGDVQNLQLRCDPISSPDAFVALGTSDIRILGQLANSSNGALLGEIEIGEDKISVVVKPAMFENPLHDFEWGTLAKREVAACEMSQLLGWNLVPPTVLRDVNDMEASVQLFIPHDPRQHYFTLSPGRRSDMEKFAVFDYIVNNADRKGGHILQEEKESFDLFIESEPDESGEPERRSDEHLWGIDHGLTFHVDDKLRTVIWEFAEEPIDQALLIDVNAVLPKMGERLTPLLSAFEVERTIERVEKLLINPFHRALDANTRAFPWPLV